MSVYTSVTTDQLDQFLQRYQLGKAVEFQPIAAGITNSNYYLDTEQGKFVLTLYEHLSDDELDYILSLQRHLAGHGVRCAEPLADRRGELFSSLNNRPAAIIGCPVGFVGAAESKAALLAAPPVPALVVEGRLGGSAITVAAVNALASRKE